MKTQRGFSLVEIAVVLVIISVLAAIVVVPIATQVEQRRSEETQKQLETIKEALMGFAIASGRLPCPATAASNGTEAFAALGTPANGSCQQFVGFLPAVSLGLSPVDSNGFAVDGWGLQQNRIRYAVSSRGVVANTPAACTTTVANILTSTNGMRNASMACLADSSASVTLLNVCSVTPTGAAGAATGCTASLTSKAPFVVFSLGKNAATGGTGADEAHNVDTADTYFVSHTPTPAGSASGEFDDIVTWGSLNTLFARMVQAGKLP
ncbi:MAG: prepilin-type N-terminal cleavage/methylation domain-containing protein [Usitatibacteraceae bacterium]